jgi:hypothetical protein
MTLGSVDTRTKIRHGHDSTDCQVIYFLKITNHLTLEMRTVFKCFLFANFSVNLDPAHVIKDPCFQQFTNQ